MFKIYARLIVPVVLLSALFSCSREEISPDARLIENNGLTYSADGKIRLGAKKQNPYTVETMRQAYANVYQRSSLKEDATASPVRTTHLYLRFLPETWQAYDVLKSDTALKLYDIPFDYEIELNGSQYHDPSIPADRPTWQYTCVPVDFSFAHISCHYEILAELYLPEDDEDLEDEEFERVIVGEKSFEDALVDEAMVLTKNYADTLTYDDVEYDATSKKKKKKNKSWTPSGYIKVYDTRLQKLIPLVGVKVRARRWFDIEEDYTNSNGYFATASFKRPVNYALFYETGTFDVRSGTFGQAWFNGPKKKGQWNVDLWDGEQRFFAHVFRGARRYQYGDIAGLKRPRVWTKLKYCAYHKSKDTQGVNWGNWDFTGIFPDIKIWSKNENGVEHASDEIFSTTVHETAHASHVELMNGGEIQFMQVADIIIESWAVAVEWKITQMEYLERGADPNYAGPGYEISVSYPIREAYQYWIPGKNSSEYTPLFIDMVDSWNQRYYGKKYLEAPVDWVSGYTLPQIEQMLKHVYGLSSLEEALKANKPAGLEDQQLDWYFQSF